MCFTSFVKKDYSKMSMGFKIFILFYSSTRATRSLSNANKHASNEPNDEHVEEKHIEPLVMQWWSEMVTPECEFDLTLSGKLVIFEQILQLCQEKRDKL